MSKRHKKAQQADAALTRWPHADAALTVRRIGLACSSQAGGIQDEQAVEWY